MNSDAPDIVCIETLVATLRDPDVLHGEIVRNIYITSRPLGSEGSTGISQQGDLASDMNAKIIYFDRTANAYAITRNGNPVPPDEHVPDGDIGAVIRSFVRAGGNINPVFLTVSDTILGKGVETVRKVIPARNVELYCQHGPDPSARGVPFTQDDLQSVVGWGAVITVLGAVGVITWLYMRFFRKPPPPPESLPDMRPYMIEQRHGARKLNLNEHTRKDTIDALARL